MSPSGVHDRGLRGKSEVPPCVSAKYSCSGAKRVPVHGQNTTVVPVLYFSLATDASCIAPMSHHVTVCCVEKYCPHVYDLGTERNTIGHTVRGTQPSEGSTKGYVKSSEEGSIRLLPFEATGYDAKNNRHTVARAAGEVGVPCPYVGILFITGSTIHTRLAFGAPGPET